VPAGIQIIFYFLNGQCMIAFAFMLSSLFRSSLTAVVFAYLYVFASGLIGSLLLQTFMNQVRKEC
jgi:ABC-type transport system involved in multi-copper enzyme maturation permease subunit